MQESVVGGKFQERRFSRIAGGLAATVWTARTLRVVAVHHRIEEWAPAFGLGGADEPVSEQAAFRDSTIRSST